MSTKRAKRVNRPVLKAKKAKPVPPNPDANGVLHLVPIPSMNHLDLLDYFAAKVLPVAMANFYVAGEAWDSHEDVAEHCYRVASAMLEMRARL